MPPDLSSNPAGHAMPAYRTCSPSSLWLGLHRGIVRKYSACGEGPLFCGYLAVIPNCPVCGNDNEQYPSNDFASYVAFFGAAVDDPSPDPNRSVMANAGQH